MKRIKIQFPMLAAIVSACTGVALPEPAIDEGMVSEVVFELPAIEYGDDTPPTRLALTDPSATPSYVWEPTDTVGIFPDAGSQIYQIMSTGTGTSVATFDGGAWKLRGSSNYYSYFPYVGNAYLDGEHIPVSFTGQRQYGFSSLEACRVFYASQGTTTQNGTLHFSYRMVNALLRVDATLPAGVYVKATLSVEDPLFVTKGTYSLSTRSIEATHRSRKMEVILDGFTVTSSASPVPIFFALAPVDLNGKTVTVEVESAAGKRYRCQKTPSRTYEGAKWYTLSCPMTLVDTQAQYFSKVPLWQYGMPEVNANQIAAFADEAAAPGFNPDDHRVPYILWFNPPAHPNGTCALLISGEDYISCPDRGPIDYWCRELTERGVQCVGLVYRTPRPATGHFCRSAWQDAQQAIRIIRYGAMTPSLDLHIDADKIGVVGFGAGAHLALVLAALTQTASYGAGTIQNPFESYSCNPNWAILHATPYATSDSNTGTLPIRDGYGSDVGLDPLLQFNNSTCSMCLIHGQDDPFTARTATLVYRRLRILGKPSEVHIYPGKGHGVFGFERGIEFLTQLGFMGTLQPEVNILDRYNSDSARSTHLTEAIWPAGKTPDFQQHQSVPYLEWHFPRTQRSKAIQIIYSCGSYIGSDPSSFEVASARRYLNEKGMTVVTLNYRVPRPQNLAKHTTAWQDLQRTIRIVRSRAASYGLDPDRIGIMGASAGGHLTLMGATSSRHPAYAPIDDIDKVSCKVQWGIASCPAYALTDGLDDGGNTTGGNADSAILAPEFSFDLDTPPMLFLHGDADGIAAMNSVKAWEKLQSMGIPAEVHTLALRPHPFQQSGSPGTGSYTWLERVNDFLEPWF